MKSYSQIKALKPILKGPPPGNSIELKLRPEVVSAISKDPALRAILKNQPFGAQQQVSLRRLKSIFTGLHGSGENKNLPIAQLKLAIMQAVRKSLLAKNPGKFKKTIKPPKENSLAKRLTYDLLLLTTITKDAIGNFLNGFSLLRLVLGASSPPIIAASLFFSVLNTALLYSLRSTVLKQGLDYYSDEQNPSALLEAHEEQINTLEDIYDLLDDTLVCDQTGYADYELYFSMANLFYENMAQKRTELANYEEPLHKKSFRYMATAFSTFMLGSGSYFISKSLLEAIVPDYLGSLIGWGLIGLSMASSLALHLFQPNGMLTLFNPDYEQYLDVRKKVENVNNGPQESFQQILNKKRNAELASKSPVEHQNKQASGLKRQPFLQRRATITTQSSYFPPLETVAEQKAEDESPGIKPKSP